MSTSFDSVGDRGNVSIGESYSRSTNPDVIDLRGVEWSPFSGQVNIQRDKTSGTDLVRGIQTMQPQNIGQNAFLDNEVVPAICDAVAWLDRQYNFREPDEVKSFLSGNNTLRKMLSTIHSKIRKEFPSEKIILEVFSDSPRSSEKDIVVSVATSLPVDEAIERLDKVEDVRWDKDSKDPYVNICVKLEYQ